MRAFFGTALFLALLWGVFYLSSKGVLVRQQHSGDGLVCTYFAATKMTERRFTLASRDVRHGRTSCPRLVDR